MTRPRNYDLTLLTVEILTGNLFEEADPPATEWWAENGWVEVLGRLSSITIENKIDYDTINMAPQAGTARISIGTQNGNDFFHRMHARPMRIRYNGTTLFEGSILEVNVTATPDEPAANKFEVDILLGAKMYDLSKVQLNNFSAPTEYGVDRLIRIMQATQIPVAHIGMETYHSYRTVESYTGDALSLLNELALTHHARWYCTPDNHLHMRDTNPEIVIRFDIDGERDFNVATFTSADDQHLSGSLAILKRNETITHYRSTVHPYSVRDEQFLVDVANATELEAWNEAVRLRNFPSVMVRHIRTFDVAGIDWNLVHLTELATLRLPPPRDLLYQVGIVGISHEITPNQWVASFDFCQRFFVNDDSIPETS